MAEPSPAHQGPRIANGPSHALFVISPISCARTRNDLGKKLSRCSWLNMAQNCGMNKCEPAPYK